jgi:hypothetical protein
LAGRRKVGGGIDTAGCGINTPDGDGHAGFKGAQLFQFLSLFKW